MKPTVVFAKHVALLFMISLSVSAGCATPLKQQLTTVGLHCSITWDKTRDQKVTGYQLTVIDRSNQQAKKEVPFISVPTTKMSCNDAGANHEGLWAVTVQCCYDQSRGGSPSEVLPFHITAK